jgi:hypothetical protein
MTGRAKDEIDSEDIRQQRRFKLTAAVAGLLIIVLALGAIYAGLTAASPRQAAITNGSRGGSPRPRSRRRVKTTASIGQSLWGRVARTAEAESALR